MPNSDLMAAIKGRAGSSGGNVPAASTRVTSTWGGSTTPALSGLTNGEGAFVCHAPLGGSDPGFGCTRCGSEVLGLGRAVVVPPSVEGLEVRIKYHLVWCVN